MGCDIHAHLEIKINGTWHYYSPIVLTRNYATFSKMAGVRSDKDSPKPIVEPRGLPPDVTFMTKFHSEERWGSDGHTHSWLNLDELIELLKFFETLDFKPWGRNEPEDLKWDDFGVWLFGNSISGFKKYPKDFPVELEDVRLVFWFDN